MTLSLWDDQAIDAALELMQRLPEFDEVLLSTGQQRKCLQKLLSDDEIYQAVRTRREAVISTPYSFDGGSKRMHKILWEELEDQMENIATGVLDAVFFGYSVLEAVYKIREKDGRVGLERITQKPMEWFEPRPDGSLRYFPVNYAFSPGVPATATAYGLVCDQEFKFFLTRNNANYNSPKGEALLSRLYWPWFYRYNGWKFWGKFLERFGQPLLVGKDANTEKMAKALAKAHQDAVIAVGPDADVFAVEPKADGTAFNMMEEALTRRIAKVILGQTLTSDTGGGGGGGSYALGQVHNQVRQDIMRGDIRIVRATVQRIVNAICRLNGLSPEQTPDVIFNDARELNRERAERDVRLAGIGVRFTKEYFQSYYNLQEDEFDIDPQLDENISRMANGTGARTASELTGEVDGGENSSRSVSNETPPRNDSFRGNQTTGD
jgi:phage gp29-like protein